jgi:hypothetical protein
MARWENSIIINRPIEDVFAFVTDHRQSSKWHRSNEILPISKGPIRQGAHYRLTGKFLVWKIVSETVVSEYEINRLVVYKSISGSFPFAFRYVFESLSNSTRLTEIGEANPPPMMKLFINLILGSAKKNGERGLQMLKISLESDYD